MSALCLQISIQAPIQRCFDLARSVDLHLAFSSRMRARTTGGRRTGLSEPGDVTTWSARFFGVRFSLETKITRCARPDFFADEMVKGPFASFSHRYSFTPLGRTHTVLRDNFTFESPLAPLGPLLDHFLLKPKMKELLKSRLLSIKKAAESDHWRNYLP